MKNYEQDLKELQEKYAKAQEVHSEDVEKVKQALAVLIEVSSNAAKVIAPAVKRLQAFVNGEKYCTRTRNKEDK